MAFLNSDTGRDAIAIAIILLVGLSSFGLGRLSAVYERREPVKVIYPSGDGVSSEELLSNDNFSLNKQTASVIESGKVLASKTGTKYYLPWCAAASRIKEENKIWFLTEKEAKNAGYQPAANCKGLNP